MRTRHRVPTVFTLSMLDVFCCALGCVILLWLWNERLAKARARSFDETRQQLDYTKTELAAARQAIDAMTSELSRTREQVATLTNERDRTRSDLAAARDQAARLTKERDQTRADLENAKGEVIKLADKLAKSRQEEERTAGALASLLEKKRKDDEQKSSELAAAQKRVSELELLMRDRDKQLTVASAKSKALEDQLHDLEGQLRQVRSKADAAVAMQARLEEENKRLAAADTRIKELEKNLVGRKSILVELQDSLDKANAERRSLADQLAKLRIAADNRFAGVQLTGRRVVFLVDMSGSMKMSDPRAEAPEKWSTVVATLVKVMRSLPDLEKFQVILFGESVAVPLGTADSWLDYDATSADRVSAALSRIEPKGNTNMYAAFETAFRFRPRGLDTIYLLSDGLPNIGPGLTPVDQTRQLSDAEKGEILGRYVRQTLRESWNRPGPSESRVRINSIGFFYESPDLGAFLWALAREHDGSFVGMSKP